MDPLEEFKQDRLKAIDEMSKDENLKKLSSDWFKAAARYKYGYNFSWLGRPIIQLPTDMAVLQELIWDVKPDLIIETGIAYGGSVIFHASMLELLGGDGKVAGIDIDIRKHNRIEIEKHPMFKRIIMLEGSSTDDGIVMKVNQIAKDRKSIIVMLDSCHSHDHVLRELEIYSKLVTVGSYMVVFDTSIELFPDECSTNRPWGAGSNPWTAVREFLRNNRNFIIDKHVQEKAVFTAAIDGYLKRIC